MSKSHAAKQIGKKIAVNVGQSASNAAQSGAQSVSNAVTAPDGTPLIIGALVLVLLASFMGDNTIDRHRVIVGGVVLLFMLALLHQASPKLAYSFSWLVMLGTLLRFGPAVLGGLVAAPKSTPAKKG